MVKHKAMFTWNRREFHQAQFPVHFGWAINALLFAFLWSLHLKIVNMRSLLHWYLRGLKKEILKDISAPLIFLPMKHNKLNITDVLLTNWFWLKPHVLYACPELIYLVERLETNWMIILSVNWIWKWSFIWFLFLLNIDM